MIDNETEIKPIEYYVEKFNNIHCYNSMIKDIEHILTFNDDYYFLHFNNLIEKNPLITLMLLKSSNNKLFELQPINNLSLAFNIFGLESLRGFLLEYYINPNNFLIFIENIYKKDVNHLTQISNLRKNFLSILLKKLNIFNKNYLETIIFISNLGVLYTADIIYNLDIQYSENENKIEEFTTNLNYQPFYEVENEILGFSSYELFSSLLKKWNFPPIIYEIINNIDRNDFVFYNDNENINNDIFIYDLNLIKLSNLIIDFNGSIYSDENIENIENLIENLNLNKDLIDDILREMKTI